MFKFLKDLKNKDNLFLALVILTLCHHTIFIYPVALIKHFSVIGEFILPVLYIYLIASSCFIGRRTKWVRTSDFAFCLVLVFVIVINLAVYVDNYEYLLAGIGDEIWKCVPFFFLGLMITINEETDDTISKWCCLGVALTALYELRFNSSSVVKDVGYSMVASYNLLLNGVIVVNYAVRTKKLIPIVCGFIALAYELLMGTRGPVVILLASLVVSVLIHTKGKWRYFVVVLAVMMYVFIQSSAFMEMQYGLRSASESAGFSTRVFDWFLNDDMIEQTSGRSDIYEDLWGRLKEHPVSGYGLYGEWKYGYRSAHNMYLEVIFHWGWIIGVSLLLGYVYVIVKAFKSTSNRVLLGWLGTWSCFVFVRGVFGGQYLSFYVFFLLGLSLQIFRSNKYKLNI